MPIGEEYFKRSVEAPGRRAGQLSRTETYQVQRQMTAMARHLGVAGPLRGGVTILKVARKLGRVSEPLVASLVRLVRAGVDPEAVRTLVRAGGRLDLTAARGAARAAVRPEALRGLRGLGGDVYGVYAAAGPRGVLEILGIARTTGEVARAERLAVTFGSRTRAALKLLGRAALVIGQELAALIRAAYDPVMPVAATDPSHALRLAARLASGGDR